MAMLAGPRRKQKVINLRAKNNEWSNDSNKFGQKMLEKMGWSAGKGLGANENGMVEHVIARYKNDEKGLGFEDKNDQWTKHEDDFNALLANLSNGEAKEEVLHSGVSLEDKSKKSKARVHYHKFTRGKDLTKYSEKDLANIFGKKTFKPTKAEPELDKEDVKTTEQVFTEKGSMADYFKNKLDAFKMKNQNVNYEFQNTVDESADYAFKGFAGANDDHENNDSPTGFGYQNSFVNSKENQDIFNDKTINDDVVIEPEIKKKKKKSKRKRENDTECQDSVILSNDQSEQIELPHEEIVEKSEKRSKKKKNKKKYENIENPDYSEDIIEEIPEPKKKKKKNKKLETL